MRPKIEYSSQLINLGSDSCKSGYAGTYGSNFFFGSFPKAWQKFDIALLELFPMVLLIKIYGHKLKNSKVQFSCDNSSIVHVINNMSSKNSKIMSLLRPMILALLEYNISFKAVRVAGKTNVLCDRLSRGQVSAKLLLRFGMAQSPTTVPQRLRPENWRI